MTIVSDRTGKMPRTSALLGRIKGAASKLLSLNEPRGIRSGELEQVARDLSLSAHDLDALSEKNHRSGELLEDRLTEFNLSSGSVRAQHPGVLRDLQRVCGSCPAAKRCAAGFAQEDRQQRSEYCPNTQTLEALEQENLGSGGPAPLPAGQS